MTIENRGEKQRELLSRWSGQEDQDVHLKKQNAGSLALLPVAGVLPVAGARNFQKPRLPSSIGLYLIMQPVQ
jgi:hypothetical protein